VDQFVQLHLLLSLVFELHGLLAHGLGLLLLVLVVLVHRDSELSLYIRGDTYKYQCNKKTSQKKIKKKISLYVNNKRIFLTIIV